jgi:hypothetical protein
MEGWKDGRMEGCNPEYRSQESGVRIQESGTPNLELQTPNPETA